MSGTVRVTAATVATFLAGSRACKIAGVSVGALAMMLITYRLAINPESIPNRALDAYRLYLRRRFDSLFLRGKPELIIGVQVALLLFAITTTIALHDARVLFGAIITAVTPYAVLEMKHRKRVLAVELQTDGFITALGNALKATPSVGDAFISMQQVMSEPLKSEIALAIKQMRLGCTFEESLEMMGKRVGSRMFDTALASVLIGQRVGGNLPRILETSGAALRELQRLEVFVRSKMASGRIQMMVVALAPVAFVIFFDRTQPHYFDPLTASRTGMLILGAALVAWVVAVILGRRILRIEV
jgi:tight adherence protein B